MTILKGGAPHYPEIKLFDCINYTYDRFEAIKTKTSFDICFVVAENGLCRAYNADLIHAFLTSNHLSFNTNIKIEEHGCLCAFDKDNNLAMFMMPLKIT